MRGWAKAALPGLISLAVLSGCGGLTGTANQQELNTVLLSLKEAKVKRDIGSVEGNVYLLMPGIPTPLKDWPVKLIPLSPALEAAITTAQEQYARNDHAPLSPDALGRARRLIDDYLKEVAALGGSDLILSVKTGTQEPKFTSQEVPQGQWLLTAELPSKISVLLWAFPVTVVKGEVTRQSLNDNNIWLEGLIP